MGLFSSKFHKLETLAATKTEERKDEQLTAAQAELDAANAGVILVPKTADFKTLGELETHIEGLEKQASDAKAEADAAKKEAEEARKGKQTAEEGKKTAEEGKAKAEEEGKKKVEEVKGQRVLDDARKESDKEEGGDDQGEESAEKKAEKVVQNPSTKWNKMADAVGL